MTTIEEAIKNGRLSEAAVSTLIKTADSIDEKASCMTALGDRRYQQYKTTKQLRYLRLAKNCYFAARNFQIKELALEESR